MATGTLAESAGQTITPEEAENLFARGRGAVCKGVRKAIEGTPLNAYRFAALVCFAFNVGMAAFERSTLLKKDQSAGILTELESVVRWNQVNGKASAGLTKRRNAEVALFSMEIHSLHEAITP